MVIDHRIDYTADERIRGKLCGLVSLPFGLGVMIEELKLVEEIAAVRMGFQVAGDHIEGVAVVIPAGEVVRFDRTAPLLDQMVRVEWQGSNYSVFPKDLQERTDKSIAHRVDNPGIVSIHPADLKDR
jgi:hypothetical protein